MRREASKLIYIDLEAKVSRFFYAFNKQGLTHPKTMQVIDLIEKKD